MESRYGGSRPRLGGNRITLNPLNDYVVRKHSKVLAITRDVKESRDAVRQVLGEENKHFRQLEDLYEKIRDLSSQFPSGSRDHVFAKMNWIQIRKYVKDYSTEVKRLKQDFYEYLHGVYWFCVESLTKDVNSLEHEVRKMNLPARLTRRLWKAQTAVHDIQKNLEKRTVLPWFPIFWKTLTEAHKDVKDMRIQMGLYCLPTFLERYRGVFLN